MGQEKTVSYKIYLYKQEYATPKGPALEVRRIGIDGDVSTSVAYLKEKLASIFPVLARTKTRFSVMWQDDDDEWITIRTDEELVIALTEMPGPVYRLHIQFTDDNEIGANHTSFFDLLDDPVAKETGENGNVSGNAHPGVSCDGCEKPVVGFRYKCVQCPDYDLCGSCETKGLHPGHNMMRISSPEGIWPHHFFRRLNKMHDRINKRAASVSSGQEYRNTGPTDAKEEGYEYGREDMPRVPPFGCGRSRGGRRGGPFGRGGFGPGMRGGFGGGFGFPPGPGNKWFDAMMKGWTGEGQAYASAFDPAHHAAQAAHNAAHQAAHAAAAAATAAHTAAGNYTAAAAATAPENTATTQEQPNQQENEGQQQSGPNRSQSFDGIFQKNNEFLANVGQMVAAALDPFGIDVQVDVETPNGQRTSCSTTKEAKTTSTCDNENSEKHEEKKDDEVVNTESASNLSPTNEKDNTAAKGKKLDEIWKEIMQQGENDTSSTTSEKSDTDEEDEFVLLNKSPEPKGVTKEEFCDVVKKEIKEINIPIQVETETCKEGAIEEDQKGEPSKHKPDVTDQQSSIPTAVNVPINVSNQPANVLYGAPNGGPLYPELPENEPTPTAPKDSNDEAAAMKELFPPTKETGEEKIKNNIGVAKHKDPRIQVALQAMLNMGFTNEGGWLTQLLEAKEGDIGKTLDVLQPVNPGTRK